MPAHRSFLLGLFLSATLLASTASAQGFQLQQHEPAAPGDGFFGVRAPRYDAAHALVVGLTLNYGHHPLLGGHVNGDGDFVVDRVVISDQLLGHLDVSGALFGRLQLSASLPVTLLERGAGGFGVTPVAGAVVGDPRLGAQVRLFGEERAPFRAHVGGDLWIPVGVADRHSGDSGFRGLVGVTLDGRATSHVRWAVNAGMLLRPRASLNLTTRGHGTVGPALRAGLGVAYADPDDRFRVGPELLFSTGVDETAFTPASTRMELLIGGGYRIADVVEIGPAVGFGLVRSAGTPDVRGLLRIALLPFGGQQEPASSSSAPQDGETGDSEEQAPDTEEDANDAAASEPEPQEEDAATDETDASAPVPTEPEDDVFEDGTDDDVPAVEETPAAPIEEDEGPLADDATSLEPGALVVMVTFASDSDVLSPDALAAINDAIEETGGVRNVRLTVDGHGDSNGPERWNEVLSLRRARSVAQNLERLGIPSGQLTVRSFGSQNPVESNATASGRAANRRVEVRVEARGN